MMPYGDTDLGLLWFSNSYVPDGAKPLPEPMMTYHQRCVFCGIDLREVLMNWICYMSLEITLLTQWGQVTYICVSNLAIIGSDNGLSLGRRQAIFWTNTGILLIGPLTNKFQWNFNQNSLFENVPQQNGVYFVSASMS